MEKWMNINFRFMKHSSASNICPCWIKGVPCRLFKFWNVDLRRANNVDLLLSTGRAYKTHLSNYANATKSSLKKGHTLQLRNLQFQKLFGTPQGHTGGVRNCQNMVFLSIGDSFSTLQETFQCLMLPRLRAYSAREGPTNDGSAE